MGVKNGKVFLKVELKERGGEKVESEKWKWDWDWEPECSGWELLVGILLIIPIMLVTGVTLMILWGLFVVPYFGMKPLSLPVAMGIVLLVGYVTSDTSSEILERHPHQRRPLSFGQRVALRLVWHTAISIIAVLTGLVLKLFM